MKVAFRADASRNIGTGHIMRCLALADVLTERKALVRFVCRDLDGHLADLIRTKGYQVSLLSGHDSRNFQQTKPTHFHSDWLETTQAHDLEQTKEVLGQDWDWVVVDHYAISASWHAGIKNSAKHLLVLDDLADRPLQGDLLLDQNYNPTAHARYQNFWNGKGTLFGPAYALLRKEFLTARMSLRKRQKVSTVLVSFGGIDADNFTTKVLDVLANYEQNVIAVLPRVSPWVPATLAKYATHPGWELIQGTDQMAKLILRADLAIGAAGSSTWERFCLGLPTIIYALADNQIQIANAIDEKGWIKYAGLSQDFEPDKLKLILDQAIENPEKLSKASHEIATIVDGKGCQRVADAMEGWI